AHPVGHRDAHLETMGTATCERRLRRLERAVRREQFHAERGIGGKRRASAKKRSRGDGACHFFLMKKMNSLRSSACERSACPVWRENAWKSLTAPGSVATTFSTWPDCSSASAFFVRRIGSGQLRPRVSSSLSKSIGRTV